MCVCLRLQVVKAAVQAEFEAGQMLLPLSGGAMAVGAGQAVLDKTLTPFALVTQATVMPRSLSPSPQTADTAGGYIPLPLWLQLGCYLRQHS